MLGDYQKAYQLLPHGQDLLKVQASIGGRTKGDYLRLRLLVDTGASYTILPVKTLERVGYDTSNPIRRQKIFTGQGQISAPVVSVIWFNCVGQMIENFEIVAYNIPSAAGVDGLLGMDFLKFCQAVISVGEAEIRCQKP